MSSLYVILGFIIVGTILLNLLYLLNVKKENRYKQVALPLLALVTSVVFIIMDGWILSKLEQTIFQKFTGGFTYHVILLNIVFLILFLVIKCSWRVVAGVQQLAGDRFGNTVPILTKVSNVFLLVIPVEVLQKWRRILRDQQSVSIFYTKKRGRIFLKKEWSNFSIYFRIASMIPIVFFLLLVIANEYYYDMLLYLPYYPVLSLVVMMEVAWFLDGKKLPYTSGSIDGKDAIATKLTTFDNLFEEYSGIWNERVITKGQMSENQYFHKRVDHFLYERVSSEPDIQLMVNAICADLKKDKIIINESYTKVLTNLLEEKDVMIEDPLYEDFSPYFFPALYHLLSKNKKMIVLAHSRQSANESVEWLRKGLTKVSGIKYLWKISTFHDALEQNTNPDLLVVSPDTLNENSFLHYLNQFEKTKSLEAIILLQAEQIIPNYSMLIHTFNLNLLELIKKKPQYIIFSDWFEGLEHTIRNVFYCEPKDILTASPHRQKLYYIIWKTEGEQWFQQKILPKLSHRKIETEVVLAIPALQVGIDPVHFLNQSKTNIHEGIQDILDSKSFLYSKGLSLETIDHFGQLVKVHDSKLSMDTSNFTFLLVRDSNYNLINTLKQWNSTAKTASFVHVVSEPYLLREYFAAQFDFFVDNHRMISQLAPRISDTQWSVAYLLLERLCHTFLDEKLILQYLSDANIKEFSSTIEGIDALLKKIFGKQIDYWSNVESKETVKFDRQKKDFVKVIQYRLPFSLREQILPKWYRFIEIRHNGKAIGEVFEGHIYQQYLPGQLHSFNGEPYRIREIDTESGYVEVSFESLYDQEYYLPINQYSITSMKSEGNHSFKKIAFAQLEMSMHMYQANISITTSGYHEIVQPGSLKSYKHHSFTETKEEIVRSYENGSLLLIKIRSRQEKSLKTEQIAFTLSILLNELFVTLFPTSHQFVKACTTFDVSNDDNKDILFQQIVSMQSTLEINDSIDDESIRVYILEDSPIHLGLLESIRENWEHIFNILNDYLFWFIYESDKEQSYLKFGYDSISTELLLEDCLYILDNILTKKKLREIRAEYCNGKVGNELIPITTSEESCVFCGKVFPAAQFIELDDGRERCYTCNLSAIDKVTEVEPIYRQVRELFKEKYKVDLRYDIDLRVLNTETIHKMSGIPYIKQPGNPRITGKAILEFNERMIVIIENGSPKTITIATLAHELAHIWQYDNLNVDDLSIEELEGFATWVEINLLESLGELPYADLLRRNLEGRDDVYVKGYKLILERLEEHPNASTPFELFAGEAVYE
jgi:hypothetical protein